MTARRLAGLIVLAGLLAAPAAQAGDKQTDLVVPPAFNDVLLFASVYTYSFAGPATSLGLTCAGSTGDAAPLDDTERAKLNAMYGAPTDGWQGFVPLADCAARHDAATEGGPTYTELVNTGTPAAFAGRADVHLFEMTRFCGKGCGSIDHMTVIEEPTGYRLIWGVPRLDDSGDVVFDNIEGTP